MVRITVRVRFRVGVGVRVRVSVCVPSMVSMVLRPRKTAKASAKVRKLKYARLSSPVSRVGLGIGLGLGVRVHVSHRSIPP